MRSILFFLLLILAPPLFAVDASVARQINELKSFIRQNHESDYKKISDWARNDFNGVKPSVNPSVTRALYSLENLYQKYFEKTQKEKIKTKWLWYKKINSHLRVRKVEWLERYPLLNIQFISFGSKIRTKGDNENSYGVFKSTGLLAGYGMLFPRGDWFVRTTVNAFYSRGRNNSSLFGGTFDPAFGVHAMKNLSVGAGLPIMYRSLVAKDDAGIRASLRSPLAMGPELSLTYQMGRDTSVNGNLIFLEGMLASSLGVSIQLD